MTAAQLINLMDRFMAPAHELTLQLPEEYSAPILAEWDRFISAAIEGKQYSMDFVSLAAWRVVWSHILHGNPLVFTEENCRFYAGAAKAWLN